MPAANQVNMNVINRLAPIRTRVGDQAIAAAGNTHLFGQLIGNGEQMTDGGFILSPEVVYRLDVLFGYDQQVDRRDRIDIMESHGSLVFENDAGRGLVFDDGAEDAGHKHWTVVTGKKMVVWFVTNSKFTSVRDKDLTGFKG